MNTIDMCNSALLLVGGKAINNLDEPTQEARGCKVFFEQTRTGILAVHPWNCATSWHVPGMVGESGKNGAPLWPYRYAFSMPPDCLRALRIENGLPTGSLAAGAARPVPFLAARNGERRIFCCDILQPTLVYIADLANPDMISPGIRDAIVFQLASRLALHLAESRALMDGYEKKAQAAIQAAMLLDAREGYEAVPPDDSWLTARAGGADETLHGGWR
jgi:hypothetical protein